MNRVCKVFPIKDLLQFKQQVLQWGSCYKPALWLDSNQYPQKYTSFEAALALGCVNSITSKAQSAYADLDTFHRTVNDWLFGYISYDVKNYNTKLSSCNIDHIGMDDLYFFQPEKLIIVHSQSVEFQYHPSVSPTIESDFYNILKIRPTSDSSFSIPFQSRIPKPVYLEKAKQFLAHIQRGDIYEANFCMEFYAENVVINPLQVFQQINTATQAPFACYAQLNNTYVMGASPERYLRKTGTRLLSQPIKGTSPRFSNPKDDCQSANELQNNIKERSENIMIVDLVRNDFSQTAQKGSVKVTELCQPYPFKTVHQLISTVQSNIQPTATIGQLLQTTFPMGSMTGAPKLSAMQIIEEIEETKRGLYSGAIGYITPQGDFDFNVVIRTLLYNATNQYLSLSVGSAITAAAQPEQEYTECLLKAKAFL